MPRAVLPDGPAFRQILDAVSDGIFIYDGEGTLLACNEMGRQMFGCSEEELLGHKAAEIATRSGLLEHVSAGLAGRTFAEIRRKTTIEDFSRPGYLVFDSGRKVFYTGTYVRDDDGLLLYAIFTLHDATDLNEARRKIADLEKLTAFYRDQLQNLNTQLLGHEIVSASRVMLEVLKRALKFAAMDENLLITGETGVGKTLLARYIHLTSPRAQHPFVSVNCAGLQEQLAEAELFGYTEGAFTGASRSGHHGLFQAAHRGTLFLDEVGEMPMAIQAKLLSAIEEKCIRRVGGVKPDMVDVRIIFATNQAPERLIARQAIREDFYYRLATNRVEIPPLRERRADVPPIIEHALREHNLKYGTRKAFDPGVISRLQAMRLPGNVRELKALVSQIASEVDDPNALITGEMLPAEWFNDATDARVVKDPPSLAGWNGDDEGSVLRRLCEEKRGDIRSIAQELGVHRTTAIRKLKRHAIPYRRKPPERHSRTKLDS